MRRACMLRCKHFSRRKLSSSGEFVRCVFFSFLVIDSFMFMLLLLKWYLLNERSVRLRLRRIIIIIAFINLCIHALLRYHRLGTFAVWIRMAVEWICPLRLLVFSDQRWGNLVNWRLLWLGRKKKPSFDDQVYVQLEMAASVLGHSSKSENRKLEIHFFSLHSVAWVSRAGRNWTYLSHAHSYR